MAERLTRNYLAKARIRPNSGLMCSRDIDIPDCHGGRRSRGQEVVLSTLTVSTDLADANGLCSSCMRASPAVV